MFLARKKLSIGIIILVVTFGFIFAIQYNEFRVETLDGKGDCVFMIHGLRRSAGAMQKIAIFLNQSGYETININYPSRKYDIATLTEKFLQSVISNNCLNQNKKINFVTHSLGGILVRNFLAENKLENLGRVVMFAPPNQGSEIADVLKKCFLFRFIFGPTLSELGTDEYSVPLKLKLPNYEVGIIAGNKSFNPIFSMIIPGPDDNKVSVKSTKLENMTDFIEVPNSHTFIMNSKKNQELVKNFLESGKFKKIN